MTVKRYPEIHVLHMKRDVSWFSTFRAIQKALRIAEVSQYIQAEFTRDALSGDAAHMRAVCCEWVTVIENFGRELSKSD